MNSVFKISIIAFLLFAAAVNSDAGENNDDRWLGKDKFLHFGYSAFFSGASSIALNRHFDYDRNDAIVIGVSVTVSLGAAKELIDYNSPGETSSYKDFIWDVAGALTGIFIASLAI